MPPRSNPEVTLIFEVLVEKEGTIIRKSQPESESQSGMMTPP